MRLEPARVRGRTGRSGADEPALNGGGGGVRAPGGVGAHAQDGPAAGPCPRRGRGRCWASRPRLRAEFPAVPAALTAPAGSAGETWGEGATSAGRRSGTEERGSVRDPGAAEEQGWALDPQACGEHVKGEFPR